MRTEVLRPGTVANPERRKAKVEVGPALLIVGGAAVGAYVGLNIGGPVGAAVGTLVGALVGSIAAAMVEKIEVVLKPSGDVVVKVYYR